MSTEAVRAETSDRARFLRAFLVVAPLLVIVIAVVALQSAMGCYSTQYSAAKRISSNIEHSGGGKVVLSGFEDGDTPDGMALVCRQADDSYIELTLAADGTCTRASYGFFAPLGSDYVPGGHFVDLRAVNKALGNLCNISSAAGGAASAVGEGFTWAGAKMVSRAKVFGPYSHCKAKVVKASDGRKWRVTVVFSNSSTRTLVEANVNPVDSF